MDIKPDKEIFYPEACDCNWESISPEIARITSSPSYHMIKIIHIWQKKIREMLVGFDLTITQGIMLGGLMILTRDGKPVTQADLASYMSADKMMVSEVLRTLEKKGYITRKDHPTDRRAKSLEVTEKGTQIVDVALKEMIKLDEEFFSIIGDEREDLVRILTMLR